jgi:hypothetical protein
LHLSTALKLSAEMRYRVQQMLEERAQEDGQAGSTGAQGATRAAGAQRATGAQRAQSALDTQGAQDMKSAKPKATVVPDPSRISYASSLIIEEGEPGIDVIRPLRVGSADVRPHLEYFKRQLDAIETVDDAIDEIDAGYYHERRDG